LSKVIGIDLGTTNSCVTLMEGDEAIIIPNSEGNRTTSSVVAFVNGEELVGQIAKRQSVTNSENTVYSIKRLIGKKYSSKDIQSIKKMVPFNIIPADNGDAWVEIDGKQYSPQEISAKILANLKNMAEEYIGEEIKEAVITVPAYFNDMQRQATKDAGKIAGLEIKRIINEPTAAALAYGLDEKDNKIIAVYDLGGGTFDISILSINNGVFKVMATNGNTMLGGEDFDIKIMRYLLAEFKREHGIDLSSDKNALQRIKEAAEKAKHELSSVLEIDINIPFITVDDSGAKHLIATLTRTKLEELVEDLIENTFEPCKKVLEDADITINDIDDIILVGGMTRMVKIQEDVKKFFGLEPNKDVDPDEVVAMGASIQGGVLTGEIEQVVLLDVIPLSLGLETKGGVFVKIIEKNTTIPVRSQEVFTTAVDNQDFVTVHIYQGERDLVVNNNSLAKFELTDIPPAKKGVPQIEVTFDVDTNGILSVSAKDLGTKKEKRVRVKATSGLSEGEIKNIIAEAKKYELEDSQRKKVIELSNELETLLYSAKSMLELSETLPKENIEDLKKGIETSEASLDEKSPYKLQVSIENLTKITHEITEILYK